MTGWVRPGGPHRMGEVSKASTRGRVELRPCEAGLILQLSEAQVLQRIRRGKFRNVSVHTRARLDPDEILAEAYRLIEEGSLSNLALWIWREVVQGGALVTKPPSENARPPATLDFLCDLRGRR